MNLFKKYKPQILIFIFLSAIFLVLAYKDVFSERTLVPNIEPYPDTFYYSNPAWNLAMRKGYVMKAFDYESKIVTPPLYSLYLTPFFVVLQDLRVFYYANIILGLASLAIFLLIIRRLIQGYWGLFLTLFLGFFYVTNYYVYTVPSLLMAENITYFFSLLAVFILVDQTNKKNVILAGILPTAFMLIKFSNLPLAAAFAILYSVKIFSSKVKKNLRFQYIASLLISAAIFIIYIFTSDILTDHKNLQQGAGFGMQYFNKNFSQYFAYISAKPINYIWYHHKMVSKLFVIPIILGTVAGIFNKKSRTVTIKLLLYGLSVIMFMSFFYYVDARYIFMVFPLLLILSGFFFEEIRKRINAETAVGIAMVIGTAYLLVPQFGLVENERYIISLKKQIGINFKHAETPWHYIAVNEVNEYLKDTDPKTTYFATFMAPYFVNYYANGHYQYLPISTLFEFYLDKQNAHESYYKSLPAYYEYLLNSGNRIYITAYWENNIREVWPRDYINLTKNFTLIPVKEGCLGACNLYEVTLKKEL